MSDLPILAVQKREITGKCPNRRLRVAGDIPAVYYTAAGENIPLVLSAANYEKISRQVGRSKIFQLSIDGDATARPTLVWKVQKHPFKKQIVHIDFYGVDMEKPVTLDAPLRLVGDAPGLKLGGMMETFHDTMTITCLPGLIPPVVNVDVSNLDVGMSVTVKDVTLPEGVTAVYKQNYALCSVVSTRKTAGPGEAP